MWSLDEVYDLNRRDLRLLGSYPTHLEASPPRCVSRDLGDLVGNKRPKGSYLEIIVGIAMEVLVNLIAGRGRLG